MRIFLHRLVLFFWVKNELNLDTEKSKVNLAQMVNSPKKNAHNDYLPSKVSGETALKCLFYFHTFLSLIACTDNLLSKVSGETA